MKITRNTSASARTMSIDCLRRLAVRIRAISSVNGMMDMYLAIARYNVPGMLRAMWPPFYAARMRNQKITGVIPAAMA